MGISQTNLAKMLGISTRTVAMYERGHRDNGRSVAVPKTVELACAAITDGIRDYPEK